MRPFANAPQFNLEEFSLVLSRRTSRMAVAQRRFPSPHSFFQAAFILWHFNGHVHGEAPSLDVHRQGSARHWFNSLRTARLGAERDTESLESIAGRRRLSEEFHHSRAIHLSQWSIWPDLPEDLADEDSETPETSIELSVDRGYVSSHAFPPVG